MARPGPRLHLYVHFADQIDKKTPKHNTPCCPVSLHGLSHKKFGGDRESNIAYLSVFPICSVLPLEG